MDRRIQQHQSTIFHRPSAWCIHTLSIYSVCIPLIWPRHHPTFHSPPDEPYVSYHTLQYLTQVVMYLPIPYQLMCIICLIRLIVSCNIGYIQCSFIENSLRVRRTPWIMVYNINTVIVYPPSQPASYLALSAWSESILVGIFTAIGWPVITL